MLSSRRGVTLGSLALISACVVLGILRRRARQRADKRSAAAVHRLCAALPKAELHAHLHGCARLSSIKEMAPAGVDTSELKDARHFGDRSLDACFAIFGAIHQTVTNLDAVRRVSREVLADFSADGVKYLELRTTPRALSDATVDAYVRLLLDELAAFDATQARDDQVAWPMKVRLLLSIDRTGGKERAMETVRLAVQLRAEPLGGTYIVGVDFSGNPTRGCFADYKDAFEEARKAGLRVAAHAGEVDNSADLAAILAFRPDRLGHTLVLSPADIAALQDAPIPIEICPTSNVKTLKLEGLGAHPTLALWLRTGYPISISTDDSTVFNTTSSLELAMAAIACDLSGEQIVRLALAPLEHAFTDAESDEATRTLRHRFEDAAAGALARFRNGEFDDQ